MVEFTKTVSEAEVKTYYLNLLTDDKGKAYGYDFPGDGTGLLIITAGRKYKASKRGNTQIWGDLAKWFTGKKIKPGDKIAIRYEPSAPRINNRVPIQIELTQPKDEELSPIAKDIEPSNKVPQLIYRILRDTAIARSIKVQYNFKCQLCGNTLDIGGGKQYAEAHHVRPLGSSHEGPDVSQNIICLCPNHHVQLDYGAILLDKSKITILPGHDISEEFIHYHNTVIYSAN